MARNIIASGSTETPISSSVAAELDLESACTTRETARILGLNEITLQQHRARGEGPRFFRAGSRSIRYRLGDVLAFRDARMVGKAS